MLIFMMPQDTMINRRALRHNVAGLQPGEKLLASLAGCTCMRIHELTAQNLSNVALALAKLDFARSPPNLLDIIAAECLQKLRDFVPQASAS